MKSIFVALPSSGFQVVCGQAPEDTFFLANALDGNAKGSNWDPPLVEIITEDEDGRLLCPFDASVIGPSGIVLKRNVLDKIGRTIGEYGEVLKLNCDCADLVCFNCTNVLPALDAANSEARRLPDGRIVVMHRYEFFQNIVGPDAIFRVSSPGVRSVFFTDIAVSFWTHANLSGIEFREVWRK